MKKLTNMIGSFITAIAIIALPIITGFGMNSDWLEREKVEGVLIQPQLAVLWMLCLVGTVIELAVLFFVISNSE